MLCKTNAGGGGSTSSAWAYIGVTYPEGSTCTATNGTTTLNAQGTSGLYVFGIPQPITTPETWTVSCTDGTHEASETVSLGSQYQMASVRLSYTRLPEGYQEVEYILCTATSSAFLSPASFNTGKAMNAPVTTEIDFAYMVVEHAEGSSGYACSVWGNEKYCLKTTNNTNRTLKYYANGSAVGSDVSIVEGEKRAVKYNIYPSRKITENDVEIGTNSATTGSDISLQYGGVRNNGGSISYGSYSLRLYEYIRTENGTLVQDLVPCKNPNNVVGFYDLVSETFLQKDGGADPQAGPDV